MDYFFQSFLPTAKAISAIVLEENLAKVNVHNGQLNLQVVTNWSKNEREQSAREFFEFYKERIVCLDIPSLPMGERLALIEVTEILDKYIRSVLWNASLVKAMLIRELFFIKLGGIVPKSYANGFTQDMNFIRQNGLADILFHHGIALNYCLKRGAGFPFLTRSGRLIEVFFSDLKFYDLNLFRKFYHAGELLFITSCDGVLNQPLMVYQGGFTTYQQSAPLMTFKSGFKEASVEIYYRDQDVFAVLHDGRGRLYRVGVKDKRAIFPDQFAYKNQQGFKKVSIAATAEQIESCLKALHGKSIKNSKVMIEVIASSLDFKGEYLTTVTSNNKWLSYFFLPRVLKRVFNKQAPVSAIFKPWTVKEISFNALAGKRGGPSKI